MKRRSILSQVLLYAAVVTVVVVIVAPVLWLFIMSISSMRDLTSFPIVWFPSEPDFSRYVSLVTPDLNSPGETFLYALRNSLLAAGGATLISLMVGIPAAYSFSRFPGHHGSLLYVVLATYMLPTVALILPIFLALSALGMLNSPLSLAFVYCTILLPFIVWLLKGSMDGLSIEFDQAASVDGANLFQTLRYVILPLLKPAIGTAALFGLLLGWDEFFYALILTNDLRAKTLSVAVVDFAAGRATDYPLVATAGMLASLPPVVIAFFLQRTLVKGLAVGGIKG